MKKTISIIMVVFMLLNMNVILFADIQITDNLSSSRNIKTVDDAIKDANFSMENIYQTQKIFPENFENYTKFVQSTPSYFLTLKNSIVQNIINKDLKKLTFPFAKKFEEGKFAEIYGNDSYEGIERYLGFDAFGGVLDNVDYKWDNFKGNPIPGDRDWVEFPWAKLSSANKRTVINEFNYVSDEKDGNFGKTNTPNSMDLNPNMILGLTYFLAKKDSNGNIIPKTGREKVKPDSQYFDDYKDFPIVELEENRVAELQNVGYDKVVKNPNGFLWSQITYVSQAPTYFNWGMGIAWHNLGAGYITVPIAPFCLMDNLNFATNFERDICKRITPDKSTLKGEVWVKYEVSDWKYNYKFLNPEFKISLENGRVDETSLGTIENSTSSASITGNVDLDFNNISLKAGAQTSTRYNSAIHKPDNKEIYANIVYSGNQPIRVEQFIKLNVTAIDPNHPITITSKIAMDDKNQPTFYGEKEISGNMDRMTITPIGNTVLGAYDLDYDVYSKEFERKINGGNPMTASLRLPSESGWYWSGPAIGRIDVLNSDENLAQRFNTTPNYVTSDVTSMSLYPISRWITYKNSIIEGQAPINMGSASKTFGITYSGDLTRGYAYSFLVGEGESMSVISGRGIKSDDFTYGNEQIKMNAYIYNGKNKLDEQRIDSTKTSVDNYTKKITWEGTRYEIPVTKSMRNLDKDGNAISMQIVDGDYKRLFKHEDTATVKYSVENNLKSSFAQDRVMARTPGNRWDAAGAPFATDNSLQSLPYPLKSGYYYSPYAKYKATIKTVIYKHENNKEAAYQEHRGIVQSVKDSFRLDTEIPTVDKNGNNFGGNLKSLVGITSDEIENQSTLLTFDEAPSNAVKYLGGSEEVLLANTNPLFKKILEGWSASIDNDAKDSWNKYKYREYVKRESRSRIVKIEQTTEVYFTLDLRNKNSRIYSVPKTRDGDYELSATFDSFSNGIVRSIGQGKMDNIVFNIRGSMYDDLNNGQN